MKKNIATGQSGEELAVEYLQQKGYKIIKRNYRYKRSEVDIIASIEETLVFVEVKTRKTTSFGLPEESVDIKKFEKLVEAAEFYIEENSWNSNIRFDVIAILLGKNHQIIHIEDFFY